MVDELRWSETEGWASPEQAARVKELWRRPLLRKVQSLLRSAGLRGLLVGGVVRDLLLGRPDQDVDLVVECSPRKLLKLCGKLRQRTGATVVPLDKVRGTVRLCFGGGEEIDLVALQGESLREDLLARDLTINALALDSRGRLADPSGGLEDLRQGCLRPVGERNFHDDPLRVLRAIRFFAQLGFSPTSDCLKLMETARGGLEKVAGERISSELRKFFLAAQSEHLPSLLGLRLPEILWGQTVKQHGELLDQACRAGLLDFKTALAIWLHDLLPEAVVDRLKLSRKVRAFLEHWRAGAEWLAERESVEPAEVFRFSRVARSAFHQLSRAAGLEAFPTRLDRADRMEFAREAAGEGKLRWDSAPWNGSELASALNRSPGPWLGEAVERAQEGWALGRCRDLEQAVDYLKSLD